MRQRINTGFGDRHMRLEGLRAVVKSSTDEDDAATGSQGRGLDLDCVSVDHVYVSGSDVRDFESIRCFFPDSIK